MDRAISWWDGVEGARFSHADKTCYFPSGARVQFGYLASIRDHLRYQGDQVQDVQRFREGPAEVEVRVTRRGLLSRPRSLSHSAAISGCWDGTGLMCGDSTEDFSKLGDVTGGLVLTDPPYGIGIVKNLSVGMPGPDTTGDIR